MNTRSDSWIRRTEDRDFAELKQKQQAAKEATLEYQLAQLLNRHSAENQSGTPDFVLAKYLIGCLNSFNSAVRERSEYFKSSVKP